MRPRAGGVVAAHAGKAVRARVSGTEIKPFRYKDKGNVATIGRGKAVADIKNVRFHGFIAWWLWLGLHLFYLIGFQNRVLVFTRWSWSFITHGRGARLITGNERQAEPSLATSGERRAE